MTEWQPIETATKEHCREFLGVIFVGARMAREPFISFWSPTLQRFYANPTHWLPMPEPPK